MLTRNFYRPFLMGLVLFSLTALNIGCGDSDNPSNPGANTWAEKDPVPIGVALDDTTLLNSIGEWHNDIMDEQLQYFDDLDPVTRARVESEEAFSHDQIILRIHDQAGTIGQFSDADLDISDSRTRYTPIFARRGVNVTEASWRAYLDSVRLSYGMGPFYIDVYDAVANIFLNSLSPNEEFEEYLRAELAKRYTDDEKNYIRLLVSLARNSREYWDTHPLLAEQRRDAMGKGTRVTIPAWAVGDIVGGACGGLSSIFSDWWYGRPIDWGHAGGQALIWGAGGSLLPAVIKKYNLS